MLNERLLDRVAFEPNTGCWLWYGATSDTGYGNVMVSGRVRSTHRVFYELLRGQIPDGLQLDHLCRVRCCVNPNHLEPVTNAENARRSPLIGRHRPPLLARCRQGHDLTGDNVRWTSHGYRACRACAKAYKRIGRGK